MNNPGVRGLSVLAFMVTAILGASWLQHSLTPEPKKETVKAEIAV